MNKMLVAEFLGTAWLVFGGCGSAVLAASGFAANGYAEHSPGGYSLVAGFVAEVALTFFFLVVILGSTDRRASPPLQSASPSPSSTSSASP
jgi:aquaporin Z